MATTTIEKQVNELVEKLRASNEAEELKGASHIPDSEYETLKSILLKKVRRNR